MKENLWRSEALRNLCCFLALRAGAIDVPEGLVDKKHSSPKVSITLIEIDQLDQHLLRPIKTHQNVLTIIQTFGGL
jgi:hypothetical protein